MSALKKYAKSKKEVLKAILMLYEQVIKFVPILLKKLHFSPSIDQVS